MYASRVSLYDPLRALPCRAPASAPNRSGAGPHQLREPLGMLPEAPALRFPGLQKQDETGSRQARTPRATSNPAERWRGDATERPRDTLPSPRPWGSSRMVVDERGAQQPSSWVQGACLQSGCWIGGSNFTPPAAPKPPSHPSSSSGGAAG